MKVPQGRAQGLGSRVQVIAFFKDLPDVAGDEAAGVRTMAVRTGASLYQ